MNSKKPLNLIPAFALVWGIRIPARQPRPRGNPDRDQHERQRIGDAAVCN